MVSTDSSTAVPARQRTPRAGPGGLEPLTRHPTSSETVAERGAQYFECAGLQQGMTAHFRGGHSHVAAAATGSTGTPTRPRQLPMLPGSGEQSSFGSTQILNQTSLDAREHPQQGSSNQLHMSTSLELGFAPATSPHAGRTGSVSGTTDTPARMPHSQPESQKMGHMHDTGLPSLPAAVGLADVSPGPHTDTLQLQRDMHAGAQDGRGSGRPAGIFSGDDPRSSGTPLALPPAEATDGSARTSRQSDVAVPMPASVSHDATQHSAAHHNHEKSKRPGLHHELTPLEEKRIENLTAEYSAVIATYEASRQSAHNRNVLFSGLTSAAYAVAMTSSAMHVHMILGLCGLATSVYWAVALHRDHFMAQKRLSHGEAVEGQLGHVFAKCRTDLLKEPRYFAVMHEGYWCYALPDEWRQCCPCCLPARFWKWLDRFARTVAVWLGRGEAWARCVERCACCACCGCCGCCACATVLSVLNFVALRVDVNYHFCLPLLFAVAWLVLLARGPRSEPDCAVVLQQLLRSMPSNVSATISGNSTVH
eukprot:jgi/Ulvmu1/1651/UM114_0019.1